MLSIGQRRRSVLVEADGIAHNPGVIPFNYNPIAKVAGDNVAPPRRRHPSNMGKIGRQ